MTYIKKDLMPALLSYALCIIFSITIIAMFSAANIFIPARVFAKDDGQNLNNAASLNSDAVKLAATQNYSAAIEKLEEAVALEPENEIFKNNLAHVINSYANSVASSDPRLAEELYIKGTEVPDAPYNIFMNYGIFLSNHSRYEQAGEVLDKTLNMGNFEKNDEVNIRVGLGMVYYKRGFFDEAVAVLEDAAVKFKSAEAYYLKGKICYTQGKFEDAAENLEAAIKHGGNGEYAKAASELLKKVNKEAGVEAGFQSQSLYHFKIQFDGERRFDVQIDKVAQLLEEAYNEVGTYFNHYPEAPTQVIIYSKSQFRQASGSPVWVAGLYDGKIRIPLNEILYNADELKKLIFHEYTHAVIFNLTRGYCPVWLNEGFAQTLEGEGISEKKIANLKKYINKKQIFEMQSLEGSFMEITPESSVTLAYDQSLSFTGYLIEKLGQSQLIEILPEFSHGKMMRQIFEEKFYSSYEKLQADWLESLSK